MKKIFGFALLSAVLGFALSLPSAQAAGTFQFVDVASSVNVVVGQPYNMYISFLYSGNSIPTISVVGNPPPDGMKLGAVAYNNGVYNITFFGTPTTVGNYPLTIEATDNYGAFLTQPFNFDVLGGTVVTIATTTLPGTNENQSYTASIPITWIGAAAPNIVAFGLPRGMGDSLGNITYGNNSGSGTITIAGTPIDSGSFPIKLTATEGGAAVTIQQFTLDISARPSENPAPVSPTPVVVTPVSGPVVMTTPTITTTTPTPSPTVSNSSFSPITENLQVGASGQNVVNLQNFLEAKGFLTMPAGVAEGYFGNLTKQALIAYQGSVGLPDTGYCGPMTRGIINNP